MKHVLRVKNIPWVIRNEEVTLELIIHNIICNIRNNGYINEKFYNI